MSNVIKTLFCLSLFSCVSAAESPSQSPFVTKGRALGDTGAPMTQSTPKLQRSNTIKLNLPKSSRGSAEKLPMSPRDKSDFIKNRGKSVDLPQPFDFSKVPVAKNTPSYSENK